MEPTNERADSENQEDIKGMLTSSESELVKRGKEYGLTPEQRKVLYLYLSMSNSARKSNTCGALNE